MEQSHPSHRQNEPAFRINKLDVIIALLFTHLVQGAINPELIKPTEPVLYGMVLGVLGATTTLLSAFVGRFYR